MAMLHSRQAPLRLDMEGGFIKKRTIVEIEKNTNVGMKMLRTGIQLSRTLPTNGEKTTPRGADARLRQGLTQTWLRQQLLRCTR